MLEIRNIHKSFSSTPVLGGIDLDVNQGDVIAIIGPSGSGKTTLLRCLNYLEHADEGTMVFDQETFAMNKISKKDITRLRKKTAFVFQSYNLIPHQTVLGNVELALTISGVSKSECRKRAVEALEKVGLGNQLHKKPNQMSGGQMQRVAIARALINNPDILLADEPTGALDSETSIQVMELLKEIAKDKLVIMVTHNPELAKQYANRIVRIKDGTLTGDSNPYTPASGLIGVGISYLAIIPINAIVYNLTGIEGLKAFLPPQAAAVLVAISMVLTLIAGLIPSRVASQKDPVEALRTE